MPAIRTPALDMINLPFSSEEFLEVFARYNDAVWPMQWVLTSAALVCVGLLFCTKPWASRLISLLLAGLWLWMALAYHLALFSEINPAAWWFGILFLLGAVAFDWFGVINDRLRFKAALDAWTVAGAFLLIFALVIYPMIGYGAGRRYPAVPSFGLPCPTTIFTIGLLLFAQAPAPRAVFVVPVSWSVIGALAAFRLDMAEDLGLLGAGAAGVAAMLLLHRPTDHTLRTNARRKMRYRQEVGHATGDGPNRQARGY